MKSLKDEEIKIVFSTLKSNKSPGFDDISSVVIKFAFDALIEPIRHIFDLSLTKGVFPDKLKIARITPIFKSAEREFVSNYRSKNNFPQSTLLDPIMFADDTNLFYSNKNITSLFEFVNKKLVKSSNEKPSFPSIYIRKKG